MLRGEFVILGPKSVEQIIPNTVVTEGEQAFLDMMMRGAVGVVPPSGSFHMGLMGDSIVRSLILSTIPGEPNATGGYARQSINRSATGWPTAGLVNGIPFVQSLSQTFAATGVDFSVPVERAFIASAATGAGTLFSISAAFASPITVTAGATGLALAYRLYAR